MIEKLRQHRWRAGFPGNYIGEILYTRNIDISTSSGRILLSDKMLKHVDSGDTNMTNLVVPTKFIRSNADATDRYWAVCGNGVTGGRLFKTGTATIVGTWAEDTLASDTAPTTVLDIEIHESANGEQRMLACLPTDVAILNKTGAANVWDVDWGTTVAAPAIVLTTGTLHPIARLQRIIAIGNGSVLQTIDKNDVVTNSRLVIPYGFSIRNIYTSSDRFWIGCTNLVGTNCKIIEWDGYSLTYNNEYDLVGNNPLSGFLVGNIPYFITNYGYIYRYAGGSFVVDQQFPLTEEQLSSLDISPYGVSVNSKNVSILANDQSNTAQVASRKFRAGIWEFDTISKNLNHKYGIGATDVGATATFPDFGQAQIPTSAGVGGLFSGFTSTTSIKPVLIAGAVIYTAYTGTSLYGIFRTVENKARYESTGYNRGYFVTTHLNLLEISAIWEALWVKFKRFVDSGNRIVVKARVVDPKVLALGDVTVDNSRAVVQVDGTWTSTTTFTAVVPTGVVVGEEVEVLGGNGASCLFHISTLSTTPDGSATITVTVDEALPSLNTAGSRGALFRFDNWTKIETISSTSVGSQKLVIPSSLQGEFLQLKVELRGHEVEIDELIPVYKSLTNPQQV